jgi:hypothetical protein
MRQLFVIVEPICYKNLDSPTHKPIAHLGAVVKDQGSCMYRMHGHRAQSYLYYEKTNCASEKDNVIFPFPFLYPYLCPGQSWSPFENVVHHGPCPEWHTCNVTLLRHEVQELEK